MQDTQKIREQAITVLKNNDHQTHTIPAEGLYPHQWLWDSCFIAIGISTYDVNRAQTEIYSLLKGQWANGMLPHMIFSGDDFFRKDRNVWRSWLSPYAPEGIATSGITQPPVLAEAVVKIGSRLSRPERRSWYKSVFPSILSYHGWLYADRDPHQEGLVLQIHPYETGLDNTPPWISQLHKHNLPWWGSALKKTRLDTLINLVRRDTRHLPPGQRMSNLDALLYYAAITRLRKKSYNVEEILNHAMFTIEDVTFNAIFVRANQHLLSIANTIGAEIPSDLLEKIHRTEVTFEQLWDPYANQYFSRNFVTHSAIKEPSIATITPLYAGTLKSERASQLVKMLEANNLFGPTYPVPSVPLESDWFQEKGYWQGPSWVNTNWLIIDGLKRHGYKEHAAALTESTLEMVAQSGFFEYFDPLNGKGAGAHNFSWTAALVLDLLEDLDKN